MAIIKTSFTLRLNLIDHAKIKKIAESQNRSMTNMIETLVKEKIKEYEKENGEIELTDEEIILSYPRPRCQALGRAQKNRSFPPFLFRRNCGTSLLRCAAKHSFSGFFLLSAQPQPPNEATHRLLGQSPGAFRRSAKRKP